MDLDLEFRDNPRLQSRIPWIHRPVGVTVLDVAQRAILASAGGVSRRMRAATVFPLLASLLMVWSGMARADLMDPAIDRLIMPSSRACRSAGAIAPDYASTGYSACVPDNAAFHRLAAQYAFALAPNAMHSARTTGVGGWHVAVEAAYTDIDSGADYWKRGARGSASLAAGNESISNPAKVLQLYSVRLRKGFGYGIEVGGQTGFLAQSSLWNVGLDVRVSLFEGFREGIPGYIPDFAVGGGVRTITGTRQFQLTIASIDAQLSKPLRVADALIWTPWLGYQHLFTFIDSNVVDLTPRTNQEELCRPIGQAVPGQISRYDELPDNELYTGRVVCSGNAQQGDFANNRAFGSTVIQRDRLLVGSNLRHEHLLFGAQLILDLVKPADAQTKQTNKDELAGMPRQWTLVLDAGLMF